MGWTIGVVGFDFRRRLGIFLFTTVSRPPPVPTQLPIQWVLGVLSLGVKRPGREADHSPPSSAEAKNVWSYTSTPQFVFIAWCLVKHRDNFTFFTFTFIKSFSRKTWRDEPLVRPWRRWKDVLECILKKLGRRLWIGFTWLCIGTSCGLLTC
jgi:hypothetical protein